jgi:hypothetical protein
MVLRGKVYLRMQINPGDIPTLEHATGYLYQLAKRRLPYFLRNEN